MTGGCGFIGSHLVERLIEEGWHVRILDNLSRGKREHIADLLDKCEFYLADLRNPHVAMEAIRGADAVFHLANVVSGITWHQEHAADLCANFAINYNVFQACVHNKIPKVLYVSSSCVYPAFIQTRACAPYLPENLSWVLGAMPSGVYGWSKLVGEVMLQAHIDQHGLQAACVRPFNVYGPREDFSLDRGHVLPALMRRALKRLDPYEVWGSGEQDRGFTYIDDVIAGIMLAWALSDDGEPINLGYPQKVKIKDVAQRILKLAGYTPTVKYLTDMPEGDFSKGADITRAKDVLGWTPKIDIDTGLKLTWEWAKEHVKP